MTMVQALMMAGDDHNSCRVVWVGGGQGVCRHGQAGIEQLVQGVVLEMRHSGEACPTPFADRTYSGEFMTRVPGELHRRLAMEATESGVSLNRLVSFKLALPTAAAKPTGSRGRRSKSVTAA